MSEAAGLGVAGQWVWLGNPPPEGIRALVEAYPDTDNSGSRRYAPTVLHDNDRDTLAERLLERMELL